MRKRKTTEEFIQEAKAIHGDKYDYSLSNYTNTDTKVLIKCKKHGTFKQTPYKHIKRQQGCPKCANNINLTTNEFIKKANSIHNNKYNYRLVNYVNNITKIEIICPIHEVFEQSPQSHLVGKGCPKCAKELVRQKLKLTDSEFIKKSNEIHDFRYNYSKCEYINNETPVIIICPEHGEFTQRPANHMLGNGCPICKSSKGELKIKNFLNKNNIRFVPQKTFNDCQYKRRLPFDFYIPILNLCIEYDGKQHFIPTSFGASRNEFNQIKIRDSIKDYYCDLHNINLIRIPYYEFNNIEKILQSIFCK